MAGSGLDPLVATTMAATLGATTPEDLRPDDAELWMGVLLVMARDGCHWDMDDIDDWLQANWPHPDDEDAMENSEALKVYAWAMIALAAHQTSEWLREAEDIIQQCANELGR